MGIEENNFTQINMQAAWDGNSQQYQALYERSTEIFEYGPWAPTEENLGLLGDVNGLRILEIGCGGGQGAIALAKQGATVMGLDLSDEQIAYAKRLLAQESERIPQDLNITFRQGDAQHLQKSVDESQDVIVSVYTLHYLSNIPQFFASCWQILRPNGRLIFSLDHPVRTCFFDEEDEEDTIYPARSYFDNCSIRWRFGDSDILMQSYHRTISQWIEMLHDAGFQLHRLLEPALPEALADEMWPEDDPLSPRRNIPHTLIIVAEKIGKQ